MGIRYGRKGEKRYGVIVIVVVILALAGLGFGIFKKLTKKEKMDFVRTQTVNVTHLNYGPIEKEISVTGTIQPIDNSTVTAKCSGELLELFVKNGDKVKKGDPICVLNNKKAIDFKGFHTVLTPVIQELKDEGYNIETYYADKNTNFIPNDKMCDYYSKIDVYICVSITEGTPRPLIEAMGCGVPIITTDIGVAKEYLGIKQKEYIISERKIGESDYKVKKELKQKIVQLYNNREELEELSKENYLMSKEINNSCYKEKYKKYFLEF